LQKKKLMLGAIAGDVIGSVHEFIGTKTTRFPLFQPQSRFTDDSVLSIALADSILSGKPYLDLLIQYAKKYPNAGYGGYFSRWISAGEYAPYNSFGNGAAMRISPIGFAYNSLKDVLREAEYATAITHNHPEGIKGAQSTAAAILLARTGQTKEQIKLYLESEFKYDLSRKIDDIRPVYYFNETCQQTVPEAIIAFLESTSYEHAIRLAISLGGDADTLACITGGIAQAFYKSIPEEIVTETYSRLDPDLAKIVDQFSQKFLISY
jgi:ADP-ribosylglycohydrolase